MFKFVKLMIDKENGGSTTLSVFTHIKQAVVFERLLLNAHDKENLIWYMNDDSAQIIMDEANISRGYLKKILGELKLLGLLLSRGKGVYIIPKKYIQVKEDPNEKK
jgi:hypothetical protein